MIIRMYQRGITTSEISELIERMYGTYYTPQTISNIAQVLSDQVEIFHKRPMNPRFVCIYLDATYLALRRDTVSKEALHVIVGINEEGIKEVLDYRLYPTESSENYKEMLLDLKTRGLNEVLLFVSDGLVGLREACLETYPLAKHQSCWVHISRRIGHLVRAKDKDVVLGDLKEIYQSETKESALSQIEIFKDKYRSHYPKAIRVLEDNPSLTSFYDFPQPIQRSLYTTNLIECLNKQLKRQTRKKEQFPNEASLERFVCGLFIEWNHKYLNRIHKGFTKAENELSLLFETEEHEES